MNKALCFIFMAGMILSPGLIRAEEKAAEPPKSDKPAVSELPKADAEGWITLFNGKDLTGWIGDPEIWKVENGYISGQKTKQDHNSFLIFNYPMANFVFETKFILVKRKGNSGIQYRSKVKNWKKFSVGGYQADIGDGWWGTLYEEQGRGVLFKPEGAAIPKIKDDEWNQYVVTANGTKLKQEINGIVTGEYDDVDEKKRAMDGIIALQYHSPGAFEIRYKDIRVKLLPPAK